MIRLFRLFNNTPVRIKKIPTSIPSFLLATVHSLFKCVNAGVRWWFNEAFSRSARDLHRFKAEHREPLSASCDYHEKRYPGFLFLLQKTWLFHWKKLKIAFEFFLSKFPCYFLQVSSQFSCRTIIFFVI